MNQKKTHLKSPDDFAALSEYVAYIRETRGYTLQEVVDLIATAITRKELHEHCSLTRGYLSCLEAGKYTNPSPFKLQALAHVYNIPYESLLRKAGYWEIHCDKVQQDATFTLMLKEVQEMTPEELQSLFDYIDYVKSKRIKHHCTCQQ